MDATTSAQLRQLLIETSKFEIARGYFSDILNSQLVIFSVIVTLTVTILVALSWLYQRKINKDIVKVEVEKKVKGIREELNSDFDKKQRELIEIIVQRLKKVDDDVDILRGEVYRSMAQFWDSQDSFGTAFIWWLRAAVNFHSVSDQNMTRVSLNSARNSVQKVTSLFEIDSSSGEAQTLLNDINDGLYKIEKDLVYDAIKEAIKRMSTSQK